MQLRDTAAKQAAVAVVVVVVAVYFCEITRHVLLQPRRGSGRERRRRRRRRECSHFRRVDPFFLLRLLPPSRTCFSHIIAGRLELPNRD